MKNALMIDRCELSDRILWLLACAMFALACAQPTPIPCPECPEAKCTCAPDAGAPVVRLDASTPVAVDAGAPVVCTGCTCPAAEPATKRTHRQRHLFTAEQPEHSAVCPGADEEHPGRKHCSSRVHTSADASGKHRVRHYATPSGFGPADLASAYKLPAVGLPGTVAIVDAYGYKAAESDLATYRKQYGLPACTVASGCLRIVNQSGKASPLPADPPAGDDWTVETALDLDLASAACPSCKLLLVQANDDMSDGLYLANNTAALLGATVISNSWGAPENGGSMLAYEGFFNHPGIAIFVAAGDDGYDDGGAGADYPSTSAYVTAVGGTSLVRAAGGRGWTESAWSSGGSSCSTGIAKPAWQTAVTGCAGRAASDVAAVGDPSTGLAVYNHANCGWIVVGGTSAASPFVAGVYALTGHGSATGALPYAEPGAFFDVVKGSNGTCGSPLCTSGSGWDGPTGIGTPNGAVLAGAAPVCPSSCCK